MTKADVLDTFSELNVCSAYKINGEVTKKVPFQMGRLAIEPVLESFRGWKIPIHAMKDSGQLPEAMNAYMAYIQNYLGVKISYISNGPGRDQLIAL
jgi:adenylosuccinate synthase